jgi:hypothetical protein
LLRGEDGKIARVKMPCASRGVSLNFAGPKEESLSVYAKSGIIWLAPRFVAFVTNDFAEKANGNRDEKAIANPHLAGGRLAVRVFVRSGQLVPEGIGRFARLRRNRGHEWEGRNNQHGGQQHSQRWHGWHHRR